jgi:DNA/RNA-binding domain of Phe-tRNA-synthetase-like protein
MIDLSIAAEFQGRIPAVAVGLVTASVQVAPHDEALWREIEAAAVRFRGMAMDEARKLPPLRALRDAYRALGNDPTRYRGSNEALVRRISQGKELYRVNTVVDVNNLVTLQTLHSAGTFDREYLRPPVVFRVGLPGESYAGIGRGQLKIEGLPVFADQLGPFGSTTRDSERAMIRLETTRILMFIISFLGRAGLEEAAGRAAELLKKNAAADDIETAVIG